MAGSNLEDAPAGTPQDPGSNQDALDVGVDALVSAIPAPSLIVTEECRIRAANTAATRLLERPLEHLKGASLDAVLPGLDLVPSTPATRGGSHPWRTQRVEIQARGNQPRSIRVRQSPRTFQLPGRVLLLEDAAESTDPERALERYAEDLEAANRHLEQFVYGASHDLKEPLRVIQGHLEILARRVPRTDETARSSLAYARDGVQRLQQLIEGLLDYSRAGFREEPLESLHAEEALEEAVANLSARIESSGAQVTHDALPTVLADRVQLTIVFQNLLSNAIKFTGESPPRVHVSAVEQRDHCRISVTDNGVGIPAEEHARLFEMFERGSSGPETEGSGIGLALCKRIIERHDGRIWIESEPGEGTTFHFNLALADPVERQGSAADSPATDGGARQSLWSVVIVDDIDGIRHLVRVSLEQSERFQVVGEAATGREGIDLAGRLEPDLVLLDLSMPGMDGLEALPRILDASPNSEVAIFSGFEAERLENTARDLGAAGYIEKGTHPVDLGTRLLDVLEGAGNHQRR